MSEEPGPNQASLVVALAAIGGMVAIILTSVVLFGEGAEDGPLQVAMTLGLAKEVAGEGIRVNAVRPGMIDTEIHHGIRTPEEYARTVASVPAGRAGSAEEVAETILWLCSDAASYVTMSLVEVSGAR